MCPVPRTINTNTTTTEDAENNNEVATDVIKTDNTSAINSESSTTHSDTTANANATTTTAPTVVQPRQPLNKVRSAFSHYFDYDFEIETNAYQLSLVEVEWALKLNRLAANCRNISDEVFPGIHVGDRFKIIAIR